MTTWTEEQQQAIDLRGKSLLVAAAAGSGKTAVLVERIITMICDESQPVSIDRLLIVTFTNAAAAEMRERIGKAIQRALVERPLSEHLHRQSLLLQKAQITTLHSFCLDLVRQNFFQLGLDPQMKIADETESRLLLAEAMEEILEEAYSQEEGLEGFITLVDQYGGREDEQLRAVLVRLYETAQSMAQPKQWLQQLAQPASWDWFALAREDVMEQLRQIQRLLIRAVNLASTDDGLTGYMLHIGQEYDWISGLLQLEQWDTLAAAMEKTPFQRLPATKKNSFDEDTKKQVTQYRDAAKKQLEKVRKEYFSRTREAQLADLEAQLPTSQLLVTLTLSLWQRFQQKKAQRNLIDFSDMEHFCFQLLYADGEPSELAMQLRSQFDEVMVDEYQDINDLQEAILQAVSRENNLFMVGDLKQSIYGFRMANPQLFQHKYQLFPADDNGAQQQRIDLNRNFRCRQSVVDGVNDVFAQLMTGHNGDLLYDDNAALVYGANYPDVVQGQKPVPEQLQLLVLTDGVAEKEESQPEAELTLSALEEEGLLLCQQIQQLMEEHALVYDKGLQQYRAVTWRDMVVLLRSPKAAGAVYQKVLQEAGIPAVVDSGDGYFTAWEMQVMVSLLHIIDNPLQDIPLLAVLRAPFFDFSEDLLAQLRLAQPKGYFYHCLTTVAQQWQEGLGQDAAAAEKVVSFLQQLDSWRSLARQLDLSRLIWTLYKDTGFYEYVGALRDGLQRQANLRALHARARGYEQTSLKGVFQFLRFLEQMEENGTDLEPAKVLSENENVVRIMSIHKSKGLEFPVVFLGGLGRRFNLRDTQQDFLLDRQYGLAYPVVDSQLDIKYHTIAQRVIARQKQRELLQEEKRILYVAMTRARERLYLIGSCSAPERHQHQAVDSASCYLDWLLGVTLRQPLWQVQFLPAGTVNLQEQQRRRHPLVQAMEQGRPMETSGQWAAALEQQLGWQYDGQQFVTVKAQSSVTELKQLFRSQREDALPQFSFDARPEAVVQKQGMTSAEKGTLLHLLLSRVDLNADINEAYLQQLVTQLEQGQYIAPGAAQQVSLQGILDFFHHPLGQRLLAAAPDSRYRELPFVVGLDCHAIQPELPAGEKQILVQGVIDCLWQEDGQWVLVDYKSDQVRPGQGHLILERYGGQMALYRHAVEQTWGEPVKACYFYLVRTGEVIQLPAEQEVQI